MYCLGASCFFTKFTAMRMRSFRQMSDHRDFLENLIGSGCRTPLSVWTDKARGVRELYAGKGLGLNPPQRRQFGRSTMEAARLHCRGSVSPADSGPAGPTGQHRSPEVRPKPLTRKDVPMSLPLRNLRDDLASNTTNYGEPDRRVEIPAHRSLGSSSRLRRSQPSHLFALRSLRFG